MATVREVTYELLRNLGMTKIFGNSGSIELPFLRDMPPDFQYILGLHERTAAGMALGYSMGSGQAVFVNLHSIASAGNGLSAIVDAHYTHTPLVITTGQRDRRHLLAERLKTLEVLYSNPIAYACFGYEGEAFSKGGYLHRGFNDLRWLPEVHSQDRPADKAKSSESLLMSGIALNDSNAVVIIGSGAGGGTLAHELTRRDIKVVLLEAGKRLSTELFSQVPGEAFGQLPWRCAKPSTSARK